MVDPLPGFGMETRLLQAVERLNAIGVALSDEHDLDKLLEMILLAAKEMAHADGGTFYAVNGENALRFAIVRNDSLGIAMGGTSGVPIDFPDVPLYNEDGTPNHASVVAHAVIERTTINIPDAYVAAGFDFSTTRAFDQRSGYRSQSMLTVPMHDHEGVIIGVLQLLNAQGQEPGSVRPFSVHQQHLVESLASQAAVTLTNRQLVEDVQLLFESFVELIASAIDEKSPYTGKHCRRVPELTMRLAEAASGSSHGSLNRFSMSDADRYELKIASWLHDCGKITTPEWVMDKATKLECIHDRIAEVETRAAAIVQAAEAAHWRRIAEGGDPQESLADFDATVSALHEDLAFLRTHNSGGEFMRPEDQERIKVIARRVWVNHKGEELSFLSEEEVRNLCIPKGTLLPEERDIINNHIVATITMLESLPFPKHLHNVPEIAGGHHEKMDGTGYPKGLTGDQMSVQARVMAIADVFEALTSADRPYKKAMPLSRALMILEKMKDDNHIDPELFEVFVQDKVYLDFAKEHLLDEQIDID